MPMCQLWDAIICELDLLKAVIITIPVVYHAIILPKARQASPAAVLGSPQLQC
jgi:hypothetical protein